MALAAPIEVGTDGSVPDLDPGVIRSVNNDGVPVTAREHVRMLSVSPFSVCAQGMPKIVSVGALESPVRIPIAKESRQISEQIALGAAIIGPTEEMP